MFRDCCLTPLKSLAAAPTRQKWPRHLFLVFRDCCLTPLKSLAAAPTVLLASPLAVSWPPFSSVPRLLLEIPQKPRCSSHPSKASLQLPLASPPRTVLLASPLAVSFSRLLLGLGLWHGLLFLVFRDCYLWPSSKASLQLPLASPPTTVPLASPLAFSISRLLLGLGLWHSHLFLVFRDCCLTPLKSLAAAPTVLLASPLAVSRRPFSSVPRLLLDSPQKPRCSSHPSKASLQLPLASPPRTVLLASPLAVSFSRLLLGLDLWHSHLFLVFRDSCFTPPSTASLQLPPAAPPRLSFRQLFFWRRRWLSLSPDCCLVWASGTASFF